MTSKRLMNTHMYISYVDNWLHSALISRLLDIQQIEHRVEHSQDRYKFYARLMDEPAVQKMIHSVIVMTPEQIIELCIQHRGE